MGRIVTRCAGLIAGCLSVAVAIGAASGGSSSALSHGPAAMQRSAIVRPAAAQPMRVPADAALAPKSAHKREKGSGPGYVYMTQRLIGETPGGLNVWVESGSAHRSEIAKYAASSVRRLRKFGLDVQWKGFGSPKAAEGVVTLRESNAGCSGGPNVIGMTWPYWNTLPNGDLYTDRAEIALCPTLFTNYGTWVTRATIHHELGHAMGLGHTAYEYDGSYQVMNPVATKGVSSYRAGDANGLRRLARHAQQVRDEIAPIGRFDDSTVSGKDLTFTGWALLQYGKNVGVTIKVTDNGKVVRRSATTVLRQDVNSQYDHGDRTHGFSVSVPAQSGKHTYCVTAVSSVDSVAKSQLGCVTWG
jgi:hypothetical protein